MKCRYHGDQEAVAVCQKFGYGYCRQCCEEGERDPRCGCSSPETHCVFRSGCVVYYMSRRREKAAAGRPEGGIGR